jgi:hypothetical protein
MTTFEKLLKQHIVLSELRDFWRAEYARDVKKIIFENITADPIETAKRIEKELLKNGKA